MQVIHRNKYIFISLKDGVIACNNTGVALYKYFPINGNDIWRVNILKELIRYDQKHPIQDFLENDIQSIIENVAHE